MTDLQTAMGHGVLWTSFFVFAGGVGTALTPCVYPLIPITVSIFGARKASTRWKAAALSGTYVLGIALTYTSLGIIAALTGAAFGSVSANPVVIVLVSAFLIAMATSMFGAFELSLPSSWQLKLQRVAGPGYLGALGMGLIAGVIAAPCTGPVLAGVLAFIASSHNVVLGFWLMFLFAIGMGSLFFVIGTFSIAMPKTGAWTDYVKSIFGIALLVSALYFLKDAFPALKAWIGHGSRFLAVCAVMTVVGLALGAIHKSFHDAWSARIQKGFGVALVVVGVYAGAVSYLTKGESADIPWVKSEADGLQLARQKGEPALVDFTADWCVQCKELEHRTYPDPRVRKEISRFVPILVDATKQTDSVKELAKKYGVVGYPTVVLIDSTGNVRKDLTFAGFKTADELVPLLAQVK